MKRKIYIIVAILTVAWVGYRAYRISTTRSHSPSDIIQFSHKNLDIVVTYGRPYKKGRMIFGEAKDLAWLPDGQSWTKGFRALTGLPPTSGALVPNDIYWRLGANDATEISFSKNIIFGDQPVQAGKYRMYAVPHEGTWDIVLNSELGKFGLNEPNYSLDVVRTKVPMQTAPSETEQFTINFENDSSDVKMNFLWDKTLVPVLIRAE